MDDTPPPILPVQDEHENNTVLGQPVEYEGEDYSVRYNGKKYKYNENIINTLFMGIDKESSEQEKFYGNGGQVDVLILGVVDTEKDTVKLLSIPRDTICEVEIYDYHGNLTEIQELPISLSHAFGDGGEKSGEITKNAVSDLLYGLPIQNWVSLNISAVSDINDAVGGVKVVAREKDLKALPVGTKTGETVHLKGLLALKYVTNRMIGDDNDRRERQKLYLEAFVSTAKKAVAKNPLLVMNLYKKISEHTHTTLELDEILWLAGEVMGMDIDTDMVSLKGESYLENDKVKFILDEKHLYETMLDIFYVEVE